MKRLLALFASIVILFAIPLASANAQISICGGYFGVRIYEDTEYKGGSKLFCSSSVGTIHAPDMSAYTSGLNFGANWNDRVSSYKTYNANNFSPAIRIRFYPNTNYSDTPGYSRYVTSTGNVQVPDLGVFWTGPGGFGGDGFNDRASSFRTISYVP